MSHSVSKRQAVTVVRNGRVAPQTHTQRVDLANAVQHLEAAIPAFRGVGMSDLPRDLAPVLARLERLEMIASALEGIMPSDVLVARHALDDTLLAEELEPYPELFPRLDNTIAKGARMTRALVVARALAALPFSPAPTNG